MQLKKMITFSICIDLIHFIMIIISVSHTTNIKIKIQLNKHEITINKHHMIHKHGIICQIVCNHLCYIYKPNLKIEKSCQITNCLISSNQTENLVNECNITRQNSVTNLVCLIEHSKDKQWHSSVPAAVFKNLDI